ncbi:hypothetical protein AMEX_G5584 [Astyanax mexicanus]|uniref:Uncharacterized protein n=1 Tax=Astyanax mexicanus TaxID=7994 RepID=A0A8T2MA12_ASTMX|nr:hypothetical protein AMEX_G5584 [Astyanax mexicanus]
MANEGLIVICFSGFLLVIQGNATLFFLVGVLAASLMGLYFFYVHFLKPGNVRERNEHRITPEDLASINWVSQKKTLVLLRTALKEKHHIR